MPPADDTYFFVHVMKTAGMTFNRHIAANFDRAEIYPGEDDTTGVDYWVIARLEEAVRERSAGIRVWTGHFPHYVTNLVPDAVVLSLVREPVARTVSLLEQRVRNKFPDKHIEELYEDRTMFEREIHDHQTKVFSMTADDRAGAWVQRIPMDESRLAAAKTALESVDVLGCQERFDDFLARLRDERGWTIATLGSTNVGEPHRASASFRRRIAEDNRLDMELYEHARSLIG